MSEWETFCDECYYHLWRVRRKNKRGFYDGFHVQNREEAEALVATLNGLEQKLREARHKRYKSIFRRKEAERERERDEAREAAENLLDYAYQVLAELEKSANGHPRYELEMNGIRKDIARVNWKEDAK